MGSQSCPLPVGWRAWGRGAGVLEDVRELALNPERRDWAHSRSQCDSCCGGCDFWGIRCDPGARAPVLSC